jgi:hypothetical protein
VVRRITGKSIGAWFAEEVAKPLEADFFIGLPESEDGRVSNVIPPPPPDLEGMEVSDIGAKTFLNPPLDAGMAHRTNLGGGEPRFPPQTDRAMPARWRPYSR